jgi:hypothetical protein
VATTDSRAVPTGLGPFARRLLRVLVIVAAGLGLVFGLQNAAHHVATDPFVDLHTYYDAGTRLNAGEPLYDPNATQSKGLYLYPPFLAILFRPLALLPFDAVAALWLAASIVAVALTVRRAGIREPVVIALGLLALPILWSLSIGQVEPFITLLMAFGSPVGIGIATSIKLVPVLVGVYWVLRRDWRSLGRLAATLAVLGVFQLVLEPEATRTWLELGWMRPAFFVNTISPYGASPILWVAFVLALCLLVWRLGRKRHGWAAAVTLAVLVHPRLLAYQLTSLLAGFAGPDPDDDAARAAGKPEPDDGLASPS